MNSLLRALGMGWLVLAFWAGQVFTWGYSGWITEVLLWKIAWSVIGGILLFAIIPSMTLALAIAASASERWVKGSKVAIRTLSLLAVSITFFVPLGDEAGFVLFVLPFALTHIAASLIIAATLDAK